MLFFGLPAKWFSVLSETLFLKSGNVRFVVSGQLSRFPLRIEANCIENIPFNDVDKSSKANYLFLNLTKNLKITCSCSSPKSRNLKP